MRTEGADDQAGLNGEPQGSPGTEHERAGVEELADEMAKRGIISVGNTEFSRQGARFQRAIRVPSDEIQDQALPDAGLGGCSSRRHAPVADWNSG